MQVKQRNLVANKIITPDGTVLRSFGRHDYKTYVDELCGETYMVDGGLVYLRRSVNEVPYIEASVYDDAPFEVIRKEFHWGTRGKDGNQQLQYKPLMTLDTEHIHAILETQWQIPEWLRAVFLRELDWRYNGERR